MWTFYVDIKHYAVPNTNMQDHPKEIYATKATLL